MSDELALEVAASSIRRIKVLAWRDLDDPEAGGSELHMDEVVRRWAAAGLEVDVRTSAVPGQPQRVRRNGYFVERSGGRYQVFPRVMVRGWRHDRHDYDALVEIWNGVPFFGPLWFRGPRLTLLHHVHATMWQESLPGPLGRVGWWIEHRLAPVFYRRGTVATLSTSSAEEIQHLLGIHHPVVVPVGVSGFFSPGGTRSDTPLVVAVGRLVPVKSFDRLIEEFDEVRRRHPDAQLVIVGEGYLRSSLQESIDAGHRDWVTLVGRVSDDELREWYRRAWVVTSHSSREGWGMSITEAAACGTPSVVTDIAGHRDAVVAGVSGVLVEEGASLGEALATTLGDAALLARLRTGALEVAATFTWDAAARRLFELLDARARRG